MDGVTSAPKRTSREHSTTAVTTTTLPMLKRLLEFSPDAMVAIDQDGSIVLANPQIYTLFCASPDQLLGQPLERLLPERLRAQHIAHRMAYLAAPHARPMGIGLNLVGQRQDGAEFPVDISLRPFMIKRQLYAIAAIRDVSAQRQWERERATLITRLRLQTDLLDLAHDAILVRDAANRILVWNKGAEELYGWTAQEALGRVTHVLFKTRFPASPASIQAQLDREGAWEGELTHTRPDGRVVIVESRQVVVRGDDGDLSAILEINRDITARRRIEEAESATHANALVRLSFLQQLLDALPNGVYVVHGPDARLVLANRAAASVWGAVWTPEQPMREFLETHGILLTDSVGRPLPLEEWATSRALRRGEASLQIQETIHRPLGDALPILVNAVPLSFSYWRSVEERSSLASAPVDIGRWRDAHEGEPETREANPNTGEPLALVIQQDVRSLKEIEYVKDEFIGLAAHELRGPIAALKVAVGTLLFQSQQKHNAPLMEWQHEMLQELDLATDRLTSLTDDLLDVTRVQAGQMRLNQRPSDIVSLVRRVAQRAQTSSSLHQIDVAIVPFGRKGRREPQSQSDATRKVMVNIDPSRIDQVLTNLVMNAIKYSPEGGPIQIMLALPNARAGQGANPGSQFLEIQVRDQGIGIPTHQHSLIFGRFMRADNARIAGITGTGLGLYLCRELIQRHDGQIWFESAEGAGTTFFVTLPFDAAQQAQ